MRPRWMVWTRCHQAPSQYPKYITTMKRLFATALVVYSIATIAPSATLADDMVDWSERQAYGLVEGHGAIWDFLGGGGGSIGFELCSKDFLIGFGARSGFSFWAGEDDLNWDYTDSTWDNDIWIPVRISDSVVLYGGIGVTLHDMECEGLVESSSYYRNGRTRRYSYELKTVTYSHGANMDTQAWFLGIRWRFQDRFFAFGEYRRTRGMIEMSTNELRNDSKWKSIEVDMDQSCFMFGFGLVF